MKPGIFNLNKWTEKTAQALRRICSKKQAPCVGFSLVFFDPMAEPQEQWNYVIELAFDPNSPPQDEERKQLQESFEFINEGVARIMGGKPEAHDLEDYTRKVRWN